MRPGINSKHVDGKHCLRIEPRVKNLVSSSLKVSQNLEIIEEITRLPDIDDATWAEVGM